VYILSLKFIDRQKFVSESRVQCVYRQWCSRPRWQSAKWQNVDIRNKF